jgi:phytoene desaturase
VKEKTIKDNKNPKTIIIGAGIAGLALAIRRKIAGDGVDVYESASHPGGKIHQFNIEGYRFDGGPSLFTQPEYIEELFELAGMEIDPCFKYRKMDESCRYFWEDNTEFRALANRDELLKKAPEVFDVKPESLANYLDHASWKYEKVGRIFLDRSLHRWKSWASKDVLKAIPHLFRYGLFSSLDQFNKMYFSDPKLVQLFNRYATYNGSDPYRTSGMMSVIPHFEFNQGTFLPKNGMYSIAQSLFRLGQKLGVSYHFDAKVEKIIVNQGRARGVQLNGMVEPANRIVSNVDIHSTYHKLLPYVKLPRQLMNEERSSSAFIFYWGIKKNFPKLGLHNIFFAKDYRAEFDAIRKGQLYHDPTVYVNITSKVEAEDAPPKCENWFVMINTPHDQGQNWDELAPRIRKQIIQKLSRRLGVNIQDLIEVEAHWSPKEIERDTSSKGGALYGSASNDMMAAFNRHPNFHPNIENLYFCGGSVHPGGGIPLCLLSAKITSREMDRN